MRRIISNCLVLLASAVACVAPTTVQQPISRDVLLREEANQREFVVRATLEQERRLYRIAYPMLRDARNLCPKTAPKLGLRVSTASSLRVHSSGSNQNEWRAAAAAAGISDSLTVTAVADESPAAAAGIEPGDRIVMLAAHSIGTGATAAKTFSDQLTSSLTTGGGQLQLGFLHDGNRRDVILVADTLCDYEASVVSDQTLNAFADGRAVYVTTGMMQVTSDEELATVVSHEIAHNAMKHIDAKMQNATAGAFFGAILDIFAATQGVNTGGEFTSQFAQLGAMTFSQEFEREADYVGMYILASAKWPLERAPHLWRRMAMASPGSIKFASSHPTTVERYVRLEQAANEITSKRAAGLALMPETKASQNSQRTVLARAGGPGPGSVGLTPVTGNAIAKPTREEPTVQPAARINAAAVSAPSVARTLVGSRADKIYFISDCVAVSELSDMNRQQIASEGAARSAGYRASRVPGCAVTPDTAKRVQPPATTGASFVGSRVDQVFYKDGCPAALDLAEVNRRRFRDEQDALRAGYRRSKIPAC